MAGHGFFRKKQKAVLADCLKNEGGNYMQKTPAHKMFVRFPVISGDKAKVLMPVRPRHRAWPGLGQSTYRKNARILAAGA
jgi:hypothetical protein